MTKDQFIEILRNNKRDIAALKNKTRNVVLVGAGNTLSLYTNGIVTENIQFAGIVDNDPMKIGKVILGKKVTPASEIANDYGCDCLALIVTSVDKTYYALAAQMTGKVAFTGIDNYIFAMHTAELIDCYESFVDEESAELYAGLISWYLSKQKPEVPFPYVEPYFGVPEFADYGAKEVFVDCGAYVGDTIERYLFSHLGIFDRIYAFEPDRRNLEACLYRKERLLKEWALDEEKITILPYGVGQESENGYINHMNHGLGSQITMVNESGACDNVQIVALDDYFSKKTTRVSFLKMDIEGYEYDALRGAEEILKCDRPKLAICIYHNAADMYRIMIYLKSLGLGYCFKCRHHSVTKDETVLYAYVPE